MEKKIEALWRLEELSEQCQMVLERLGLSGGDSRRVNWEPTPRLLRYYTTLGLLDRAARLVGRTAYYSRRHLLQLLAIKQLQQQGQSLQTIQIELLGKTDLELMKILGISSEHELETQESPSPRARFWDNAESLPPFKEPQANSPPALRKRTLVEISLAAGIHLTVDKELYPALNLTELEPLLQDLKNRIAKSAK